MKRIYLKKIPDSEETSVCEGCYFDNLSYDCQRLIRNRKLDPCAKDRIIYKLIREEEKK